MMGEKTFDNQNKTDTIETEEKIANLQINQIERETRSGLRPTKHSGEIID